MTASTTYFITGASIFTLLALWFYNVYQALSRKRKDVFHAEEQVRLLRECFQKMRNSPDEEAAGRMLETSIQTYIQTEKIYNETLQKPTCRFPGSLMGFRRVECVMEDKVEDPVIFVCEDCGYMFYRAGEINGCPYCGKQRTHLSSGEEAETLMSFRKNRIY